MWAIPHVGGGYFLLSHTGGVQGSDVYFLRTAPDIIFHFLSNVACSERGPDLLNIRRSRAPMIKHGNGRQQHLFAVISPLSCCDVLICSNLLSSYRAGVTACLDEELLTLSV